MLSNILTIGIKFSTWLYDYFVERNKRIFKDRELMEVELPDRIVWITGLSMINCLAYSNSQILVENGIHYVIDVTCLIIIGLY